MEKRPSAAHALLALLTLAACAKAPAEPVPGASQTSGASSSSASPASAVAPLVWDAPGTWAKLDLPTTGPEKAAYRVEGPATAEVYVSFYGTGAGGDPARVFKGWFGQFDGDVGPATTRETFRAGALQVETAEVHGTYKISLTPPRKGRKEAPVSVVKKDHRLCGAVVRTPDRGNWFFKLVGPDEAVQAARPAFRRMLESAR
jgi:hypothetical protein